MKIVANAIREGNILLYNDGLWKVVKPPEHTKPGKGPAYIQVEMKNLKDGTKLNTRFNSSITIEKAFLDQKEFQYLYTENNKLIFMDNETFEQIELQSAILEDKALFLTSGIIVKIELHNNEPLNVILPYSVDCEIEVTDPIIKGATATSSYKPALLTNGIKVKVPQYIVDGEKIRVKTEDNTFIERVK